MITSAQAKRILIFDGLCNLCEASVIFIIRRDKQAKFSFTQAQSEIGRSLQEKHQINQSSLETFAFVKNDILFTKSSAALEVARELDGFWRLFRVFKIIPPFVRDTIYEFIAKNRYHWFGKKQVCMMPTNEFKDRFL